jgi:predicted lactoylglutathione lyase
MGDWQMATPWRTPMIKDVWINLPVKDLARSASFYERIGLVPHPGPGNTENSACFLVGEKKLVLMLFVESTFGGFIDHAVAYCRNGTEVLFSVGMEDRARVDEFAGRVRAAGGTIFREPCESNGFMYGCGIIDPDGHRWNALYMDFTRMPRK